MVSRLLRRSGMAFAGMAEILGWRPDYLVQVGIGEYFQEVDVLKETWPKLEIIGFEPHPHAFKMASNYYPGMLFNVAISNYVGESKLYVKKKHKDGSSLFPHIANKRESYGEVNVKVTTLDHYLVGRLFNGNVLLWIDCEGSELAVLEGAKEFIGSVQMVNVEVTGCPPGEGWCTPAQVHEKLVDYGFRRQWIHTHRMHCGQCDAIYVRPELWKREYCCDPWGE